MNTTKDRLIQVFYENHIVDTTDPQAASTMLMETDDIDSLAYISLLVNIEEAFDIELPDEVMSRNMITEIDTLEKIIDEQLRSRPISA